VQITSRGLVTTTTTASGAWRLMAWAASLAMPTLIFNRSMRSMPGLRGTPAVSTTTSAPATAAKSVVPSIFTL
jgi:hypothetical protein